MWYESVSNLIWIFPSQLPKRKLGYLSLTLSSRNLLLSAPVRNFSLFSGLWLFSGCLFSPSSSGSWLIWWSVGWVGAGESLLVCLALPIMGFWSPVWVSAFKFSFSLLWRNSFTLCYSQGRLWIHEAGIRNRRCYSGGVNSGNSAWWKEGVKVSYLCLDHLVRETVLLSSQGLTSPTLFLIFIKRIYLSALRPLM